MCVLDEPSLLQLSVPGEVARKVLHYLKQTLQSSCLGDLLCSHAFAKHYLRRGGADLQDDDPLTATPGLLGGSHTHASSSSSSGVAVSSSSSSSSSSAMGSLSKKPKKEPAVEGRAAPAAAPAAGLVGGTGAGSDTESELPSEDETKYPEDLEEKIKGVCVCTSTWPELCFYGKF